jgi:hypothetical protein
MKPTDLFNGAIDKGTRAAVTDVSSVFWFPLYKC